MWVKADTASSYQGFAKKLADKDLIFIKYQVKEELLDYRCYIIMETAENNGLVYDDDANGPTMYGVLGGIERGMANPVMTRIAMRKRMNQPLDLEASGLELQTTKLTKKNTMPISFNAWTLCV